MIISSFFRMRSFRFDKASLLLKLCLPFFRAENHEEEEKCDALNSFYGTLAEKYADYATHIAQGLVGKFTLRVNFSIIKENVPGKYRRLIRKRENTIIIERTITASEGISINNSRHTDVIDTRSGFFLK